MSPEEYKVFTGPSGSPKDAPGRFIASEEVVIGPDGWSAAVSCVGDGFAKDIAARLNGPSPAEVAAMLREVGHGYCGSCDRRVCPSCSADMDVLTSERPNGGCFADCKLDAMIKQCEGA